MSVRCPVGSELRVPHFETVTARAVDQDGLLGIVNQNVELLKECSNPWVDPAIIEAARVHAKNHDGHFDPMRDVERAVSPEIFQTIGGLFIAAAPDKRVTLYDDAAPFLRSNQNAGVVLFGLTHGSNPLWQLSKVTTGVRDAMHLADFHGYLYTEVMTGDKEKGPHLADIRGIEGTYDFEALDENGKPVAIIHARGIELDDDRNYSHKGMPADCTGKHTVRSTASESRQAERVGPELADRVDVIRRGLGEISVTTDLRPVDCNALHDAQPHAGFVAFRPAYSRGNTKPGTLITPRTTFIDLQQAAARQLQQAA